MSIAWWNLLSLHISAFLLAYVGVLSLMPVTRAEKRGEKAWKECEQLRSLTGLFEFVLTANMVLWIWFPVPQLAWPLDPSPLIGEVIAFAIAVPSSAILVKGIKDAGRETMHPSKNTKMFEGIYHHMRHPQTLGEMLLYVVIAFFINSLFLVLWTTVVVILITATLIYYEEKDLVKRSRNAYLEYQQQTGALIPKFWKKRTKQRLA
jgi:protein-S-isoprenylcysteine O-methyltransferase Ste14